MEVWMLDSPLELIGAREAVWARGMGWEKDIPCPANPTHRRLGLRKNPLKVRIGTTRPTDIIWSSYSEILCSEKVVEIFEREKLTGYRLQPVEVNFTKAKAPPRYWEFVITGWGGLPPPEARFEVIDHCPGCKSWRFKFQPLKPIFDPRNWDGSDFFVTWPLGHRYATQRVVDVVKRERITGIEFKHPSSFDGYECGGGSLKHYLPDDRAREIGEPLGIY